MRFSSGFAFSFGLVLALSSPAYSQEGALKHLYVDQRLTHSRAYSELFESDATKTATSDKSESSQDIETEVSIAKRAVSARRARALSKAGHPDEALAEWNQAIDGFPVDASGSDRLLSPLWLFGRADVEVKLGRREAAVSDIERALKLGDSEQTKFPAALLQIEVGNFADAESVLPDPKSVQSEYQPYFFYLLALAQQGQSKNEQARLNFEEAASLFAADDELSAAQACIDACAAVRTTGKSHRLTKISDLPRQRAESKAESNSLLDNTRHLDSKLSRDSADAKIVAGLKAENQSPEGGSYLRNSFFRLIYRGVEGASEKVVNQLLSELPTNCDLLAYQADNYFREKKFDQALESIDLAINYEENPSIEKAVREAYESKNGYPWSLYRWNTLGGYPSRERDFIISEKYRMKKVTYLLAMGRFADAYEICSSITSPSSWGEHFLMRARIEIKMKRFSDAVNDLNQSSKHFYDECRIDKRDEVEKLLESLRSSSKTAPHPS